MAKPTQLATAMQTMNQTKFLAAYTYALSSDFASPDGTPAEWASEQPAHWGSEAKKITVNGDVSAMALSADEMLLAVAVEAEVWVYDLRSGEVREVLKGGKGNVGRMLFLNRGRTGGVAGEEGKREEEGYVLVVSSENLRGRGREDFLVLWELNAEGKDVRAEGERKVDVEAVARKAMGVVAGELVGEYGWSEEGKAVVEAIEAGIVNAIAEAVAAHGLEGRVVLHGSFGGFGSVPVTADGKKLLYKSQNESTQHAMRGTEKLPCIHVWDIETRTLEHKLLGHTDAIMWIGGSPDSKLLASVSWDGTVRVWDVATGDCLRVLGPFGGQMWAGAFSPDSKYLAFSQGSPKTIVYVYDLDTGEEVSKFEGIKHWARSMDWSPDGKLLASGSSRALLCVWDPYTGEEKMRWEHKFEDEMMKGFLSIWHVKFINGGKKLVFQTTEGSIEVYDLHQNRKWQFSRGPDHMVEKMAHGDTLLCAKGGSSLISADVDQGIRFWDLE